MVLPDFLSISAAAGLLTRFYSLIAGVSSWLIVLVVVGPGSTPLDVVGQATAYLGITEISELASIDAWMQARKGVISAGSLLIALAALVWSGRFVFQRIDTFLEVRGPATAWICAAILTQLYGSSSRLSVIILMVVFVVAGAGAVAVAMIAVNFIGYTRNEWKTAILFTFLACIWTVVWPALFALHALGGSTPVKHRGQDLS